MSKDPLSIKKHKSLTKSVPASLPAGHVRIFFSVYPFTAAELSESSCGTGDNPRDEEVAIISLTSFSSGFGVSFDPTMIPARSDSRPILAMIDFVTSTRFFALLFPSK
jgi:hypothetical protein